MKINLKVQFNFYVISRMLLLVLFCIFFPVFSFATINKQISYQGKLTNSSNVAVSDASYNMKFQICTTSDCTGGSDPIWTETLCYSPDGGSTCDGTGTDQRVDVSKGIFSEMLGEVSSLSSVDFNQTLYLEVQVGGSGTAPSWETLTPRKVLGSVPAAIESDQLDGLDTAESGTDAHVVITDSSGNLTASANLTIGSGVTLSEGSTNRLDLATGDSLNIVSGNLQFGGTTILDSSRILSNITQATIDSVKIDGSVVSATGSSGLYLYDDGSNGVFIEDGGQVGIGTVTPSSLLDLTESGTVKGDNTFLTITNSGNAVDMDGTISSLLFNQYYYDASTPALVDAAKFLVGTETDWTSAASTQDSYMSFSTVLDGVMEEWMKITSGGNVNVYDSTGADYLQFNHDGTNAAISTNAGELQLGSSGDFMIDSGVNVAIGASSANELLTVEGVVSLDETTAPSLTSGYGKLYVKSSDSTLYFMDDSGTEFDLTTGGSVSFLGLTDTPSSFTAGSVLFTSGSAVTEDNSNFYWDDTNNRLGIGINTPSSVLDLNAASGVSSLMNVATNGSDILTVTSSQTTIANPLALTSAGDTSVAHDLVMTNSTAAYMKFSGPGYIETDSSWQNLDLTLSAAGTGEVIISDNLLVEGNDSGYLAQITNTNTGASTSGVYVYLEGDGALASTNNYVGFGNSIDSTSGSIYASDDSTVVYGTTGGDYAEFYYTDDVEIGSGDVVCVDIEKENTIKRCDDLGDSDVMGVISTAPGFLGKDRPEKHNNPNYKMVAMVGQIPTKVNLENGEIHPGDSLTSSSESGFAMKANAGDPTVGVALEFFPKNETGDSSKDNLINVMISRKNKSLTVDQIEQEVVERVAKMEFNDEIDFAIARSDNFLNLDKEITDLAKNVQSYNDRSSNRLDYLGTGLGQVSNFYGDLRDDIDSLNRKLVESNEGYTYVSEEVDLCFFEDDSFEYFTNLMQVEVLENALIGQYQSDSQYAEFSFNLDDGYDLSMYDLENAYLSFDVYIENADVIIDINAELGNQVDKNELEWEKKDFPYLLDGWNTIKLAFPEAILTGEIDWEDVSYFRTYFSFKEEETMKFKNIKLNLYKKELQESKFFSDLFLENDFDLESDDGQQEAIVYLADNILDLKDKNSDLETYSQIESINNMLDNLNIFDGMVADQLSSFDKRITVLEDSLVTENFQTADFFEVKESGEFLIKNKLEVDELETEKVTANEYVLKKSDEVENTGSVTIESGKIEVFIENSEVLSNSRIIVTPLGNEPVNWIVSEKIDGQGFVLKLEKELDFDINFDYWIVKVQE